jgi:opacity protein-like surface antigen
MKPTTMMKRIKQGIAALLFCTALTMHAQSAASGSGATASLWAGVDYTDFKAGFPVDSNYRFSGIGAFVSYSRDRHWSLDAHARFLTMKSWNGETEQDWLIGPRYSFLRGAKLRPYGSLLIGAVKMHYPFQIGDGTNFALAPGGGLEYRRGERWSLRAGYEYQTLLDSPRFTNETHYGIKPNGFTAGVAYKIFGRK